MSATRVGLLGAVLGAGMLIGAVSTKAIDAPKGALDASCGAAAPQVRTTLYFGTARPKGSVSELEWQMFLRDEVTARFPDGLTVWEAEGQWKQPGGAIGHERSKVLLREFGEINGAEFRPRPRLQEDVLQHLLGLTAAAQHAQQHRVPPRMAHDPGNAVTRE